MSSNIIDIFDDNSMVWLKSIIQRDFEIPDYVKKASIETGDEGRKLKKSFAAPELGNKFAMDTPADIWLSKAYLAKTANNISGYLVPKIEERLKENEALMGVDIQLKTKHASKPVEIKYEVPLEKFALAIPKEKFASNFVDKFKNFFYRDDHLCLYPLNTPDQIKTANNIFPKGLVDELELFRPVIAQKIAALTPEENLSKNVQSYLPMSKSAALGMIETRISNYPKFATEYSKLKAEIIPGNELTKTAVALEKIDIASGANKYNQIISPKALLRGVYEDKIENVYNTKVAYYNEEIPFNAFEVHKDELVRMFPDIIDYFEPTKMASYLDGLPEVAAKLVINRVKNK